MKIGTWLLALIVVSLPVLWMQQAGKTDWAWWYVAIILAGLLLTHPAEVDTAVRSYTGTIKTSTA